MTSLVTDPDGNIYAASIGEKNRAPAIAVASAADVCRLHRPPSPPSREADTVASQSQPGAGADQRSVPVSRPSPPAGGAEVVKIAPDGSPQTLWTSRDDLVLSMGLSPTGKLLLGTGDNGTLIELEGDDVYSSVANTASEQVTSLVAGPGGKVFVATANPGKDFHAGSGIGTQRQLRIRAPSTRRFSRAGAG